MKVCHIGFSHYPGIGSVSMYEHSRNLAALGADITVIAAGETSKDFQVDGVRTHFIKSPSVKNFSVYPLLFTLKAVSYLRKLPGSFDVVHVYHFPGSSLLPLLLKRKAKKWIFFTTSGPVRGGILSKIGWGLQSLESRFFDHIILRDESHIPQFSYRREVTIVPIGADFKLFSPGKSSVREQYKIDPDSFLFLYAGNLHPVRKIEVLIDGLKMVKKAHLMIVGDTGEKRLRDYAENAGMSQHITFTGAVPYREVPLFVRCCDVFLSYVPITPEFDIQPPLKTLEALACGVPVIATDTLGNRRFITHRKNGYLVEDDAVSLGNAMRELMEDKSLLKTLRENARSSVADYDWSKIVKNKLLPTYTRLVSGGN